MVLKVKVTIGANEFSVEGEMPFAEVRPLLESWLDHNNPATVAAIQSITAELKAENDKESKLVQDHAST